MIGNTIKDVDRATLDGYYIIIIIIIMSYGTAFPYDQQWVLDGLPNDRPCWVVFVMKVDDFKETTNTLYYVSKWLPNSVIAVELLRDGAMRHKRIGESWSVDKPVWMALERLDQRQKSKNFDRFNCSSKADEAGFHKDSIATR